MDGNVRLGGQGTRIVIWSMVLLLAVFVFFLVKSPPIPNTFAVVEPVGAHGDSGYVYLAGQWYDLNGRSLDSSREQQIIPRMLAPLLNGELLVSTSDRQLWRCRHDLNDCEPWARDIDLRNRFQLVGMDDGNVVLLSHTPSYLYLLDQGGRKLDSQPLQGSRASLSRLDNRVFLTSGGRKMVRAMAVKGDAFGTLETVVDLSEQSLVSGHDRPQRLRRVDGYWWLSLLGHGDRPRFAVFDDHWNLVESHAPRVDGRITDWFVDEQGQLLLASSRHKLFRHDPSRGESTLLFQAEPGLLVRVHDNFLLIFALFLVVISAGIVVLVIRAQLRMESATENMRKSLDAKAQDFDAEAIESMRRDGPVWLSPNDRSARIVRWQNLIWKLAPIWSGALLVLGAGLAFKLFERSDSLLAVAVFGTAMILGIIQALIQSKHQHENNQQELGIEERAVLLRDPAGRVERFTGSDLLFDGDRLLIDRVSKRVFQRQLSWASPTLENRHFLYQPAIAQVHLKTLLEEVPMVTLWKMNSEISRRRKHLLLDRAVLAAAVALPFISMFY